ncbi:hypothetical protein GCM10009839_50670 [Catenulispora yoronensis]|uniref:Uncharacterized protein n=1 Tax=Catenulispora yoronensis TaxID=450799 RepID=A0ABN2US84_9ACTN
MADGESGAGSGEVGGLVVEAAWRAMWGAVRADDAAQAMAAGRVVNRKASGGVAGAADGDVGSVEMSEAGGAGGEAATGSSAAGVVALVT